MSTAIVGTVANIASKSGQGSGGGSNASFNFGGTWSRLNSDGTYTQRDAKDIGRNFLDPSRFGGIWGGGDKEKTQQEINNEILSGMRVDAGNVLQDFYNTGNFNNLYQVGTPYRGPLGSYQPTLPELQGSNVLSNMITGQAPELFRTGSNEINELVSGDKYDPMNRKDAYFTPYKNQIMEEYGNLSNELDNKLGKQGDFYSSNRSNQQRKLTENTGNQMSQLLGNLYQNYANNKIQGATTAANMGQMEQRMMIEQIQASQQYGQLQRTLEDQQAKEAYNEWLRQRSEYGDVISAAQAVYGSGNISGYANTPTAGNNSGGEMLSAILNTALKASTYGNNNNTNSGYIAPSATYGGTNYNLGSGYSGYSPSTYYSAPTFDSSGNMDYSLSSGLSSYL